MISEAWCLAHTGDRTSDGKAYLQRDELVFRGDFTVQIRLADITSVTLGDGVLELEWPSGAAAFELGPKAEIWAARIAGPQRLKPGGATVTVLRADDEVFLDELRSATSGVTPGRLRRGGNVLFFGSAGARLEAELKRAARLIPPGGVVWVVHPKDGSEPAHARVLEAAASAGLSETATASLSQTHDAVKFVSEPTLA